MSFLCNTEKGKMYFKCLSNSDKIIVKLIDKNDKLISKETINQEKFNLKYQPLIRDQLNYKYRWEFWENL